MAFQRPTLKELKDRAVADLDSRLPGSDARLRRANTAVIAAVHSGAVHSLHGHLEFLSRQILATTADEEFLERHAGEYGQARKEAKSSAGQAAITGLDGALIEAGTIYQRSDGAEYSVAADTVIAAGVGTINLTAVEAGAVGNTEAGSTLALVNPIDGVQSTATVDADGLTGGYDIEDIEDLRRRHLERKRLVPHSGADFDYVRWALEVTGVTRAWCYPNYLGIGTVGVTFVCDDQAGSIIPDGAKIAEVAAYIEEHPDPVTGEQTGRPVTADIHVFAPALLVVDFTILVVPATAPVRAAVAAEIDDLFVREAVVGGTIPLSHVNEAISTAAGETDHDLVLPIAPIVAPAGQLPVVGVITWV